MDKNNAIDIVYLWVDGNDPAWRAKRRAAVATMSDSHLSDMALYGNVEGRYRDNDELRYNLRALERYFPDHGHIYVVTDAQSPAWLRPSSRLTLIDHRDLIPAANLPIFDSGNIESYIHHIEGLSERYFYLNDDMLFGAPVIIEDWFSDQGTFVAWSDEPLVTDEPPRQDATALENACRLSHQWFINRAANQSSPAQYKHTFRTFAHGPRPMRKSMLLELELYAPDMFAAVRSTVFRSWDKPPIVSDFVMRWALAHGRAEVRDYRHLYISSGEKDNTALLLQLVSQVDNLAFFCINDTTDDAYPHDPRLTEIRQVLQTMFPVVSDFELPF